MELDLRLPIACLVVFVLVAAYFAWGVVSHVRAERKARKWIIANIRDRKKTVDVKEDGP